MKTDIEKALAEIELLRGFIDFLNQQLGIYMDALSGFEGNRVRINRRTIRVNRPVELTGKAGKPTMVYSRVEDPNYPKAIFHNLVRAEEFVARNAPQGFNERHICWAIIVFVFAYWDEEIRPSIARIRGISTDDVQIDELGDLRIVRNCIIHENGKISTAKFKKLKVMTELFVAELQINLTYEKMHRLFILMKQAINRILLEYTGHLPDAPDTSEVVDVVIQRE